MFLTILLLVAVAALVTVVGLLVGRDGYGGAPPRTDEPWWAGTTLQVPR